MSDFNTWDEVKEWLSQEECVNVKVWTFSQGYMCCSNTAEGDMCCEDNYRSVEEAVEDVKRLSDDKIEDVRRA